MNNIENTSKKPLMQRTAMVWCCALFATALWGSAFPCVKTGYALFQIAAGDTATQILFAGLRFFGAGVLALLMGSGAQKTFLKPKKASWGKILILSMFQTFIQYTFFYIGMAHTTSTKGSVLQGCSVLFSLLIVCLLFRTERLTLLKALGCIIGFAGIVLINVNGAGMSGGFCFTGEGFVILSTLSASFSAVFLKQFSASENPVTLSSYQFMVGGALLMLVGLLGGGRLGGFTFASGGLLLYMAFLSAAAYSLWGILLKHNPVSRISVFGFMIQIFGVLFSALILKETSSLTVQTLVSLVLVCGGIFLVNHAKSQEG